MLVTRAQTAKMLSRLISDTFGDNLKSNVPEFTQVFDSEAMDRADVFETESVGTGYAGLIPEGRSVDYLGFGEGYTAHYRALKFGAGTQVTEEQVDDNLWMKMGAKAGVFLEESLRQTKELFHAQVFNDPTLLGGDGVALLSTAHPTVYGGTQSNTLAVPSQFSESALEEMLVKSFQGHQAGQAVPAPLPGIQRPAHPEFGAAGRHDRQRRECPQGLVLARPRHPDLADQHPVLGHQDQLPGWPQDPTAQGGAPQEQRGHRHRFREDRRQGTLRQGLDQLACLVRLRSVILATDL
jgi:hypothetical protein